MQTGIKSAKPKEPDMEQLRTIESDIPDGMTAAEYRRLFRRPRRWESVRHRATARFGR